MHGDKACSRELETIHGWLARRSLSPISLNATKRYAGAAPIAYALALESCRSDSSTASTAGLHSSLRQSS